MSYWFKDMGVDWFLFVVQQDGGVVVEVDDGIVGMMYVVFGVNDYGSYDLVFFYFVVWNCFFDGDFDDVVDVGVMVVGIVEYFDVYYMMCVVVVSDIEYGLSLNYIIFLIFSFQIFIVCLMILIRVQVLVLVSGWVL